ncbi:MAG: hypothetical protein ACLQQ4_13185 [Bacteroidia bacterium]
MKTDKLLKKYGAGELADSLVFRQKLKEKDKRAAAAKLKQVKEKALHNMTAQEKLQLCLLQLKFKMEDYFRHADYSPTNSFGHYLQEYVKVLNRKNKDFASEIGLEETELSQLINGHRNPNEKILYRLEIHSHGIIPAIIWYRLLEKKNEHEIISDKAGRKNESSQVKNVVKVSVV